MHILHDNYTVGENGHLYVGGCDTVALAEKYGTPLYVVDEGKLRSNMQRFSALLRECFPAGSRVLFASKALSYVDIYRIASSEGIGADVVSPGELYTACKAGFDTKNIYFHGNNKTDADIAYALDVGVGTFVVDNEDELLALDRIAGARGKVQDILLRISPGIDPHTHKKVVTGSVDSKFGTAIETGQAMALAERALALSGVRLKGFHCHIGSQIFDSAPFIEAAEVMLAFIADVYRKTGFLAEYLNLGGGYGVSYTEETADLDAARVLREIGEKVRAFAASHGIAVPKILIEPGHRGRGGRDAVHRRLAQNHHRLPHLRLGGRRYARQPALRALSVGLHGAHRLARGRGKDRARHHRRPLLRERRPDSGKRPSPAMRERGRPRRPCDGRVQLFYGLQL